MLDLDKEKLGQEIEKSLAVIRGNKTQSGKLTKKIREITTKKTDFETSSENLQRRIELLREYIVIANGIPPLSTTLRKTIINMKRRLAHEDMLISERESLKEQISENTTRLQHICGHPFVIGYIGYGGSYSREFDDAYKGHRLCLVCGLPENGQSRSGDDFKILSEHESCLIQVSSESRDEKMRFHQFDIWQPLEPMVREIFLNRKIHDFFKRICATQQPR